jgi:peptide/nickel transport system ATP-binding protein
MTDRPLLEVQHLCTEFKTDEGVVRAVDDVSWSVSRGETLAIVGESGCGKSVTALSVMRLLPTPPARITGGRILLHETDTDQAIDLLELPEKQMRNVRGRRVAMVFQEPTTSLNPVYTVGDQIAEAVELHQGQKRKQARATAVAMLEKVGIPAPAQRAREYPHQMSGGMRQRVMIAMALSCNPSVLIADEPTTALDVTIQAQILDLLRSLQESTQMGIVLITHDLGVVAQTADRVCVMYAGKIVEHASVQVLFANPMHPYTRGLLDSLPRLSTKRDRLQAIPGQVPNPIAFPVGCRFHPRCALTRERAQATTGGDVLARCADPDDGPPGLLEVEPNHFVACCEVGIPATDPVTRKP